VVRWLVLAIVAVLLASLLLSQFDGARKFPLTLMVYQARAVIMDTLGEGLRQNLPTRIGGRDRTDWILIVLALATSLVAGRIGDTARKRIFMRQMDEKVASLRAGTGLKAGSALTRELEEKVKTLKSASKSEREELLRIYAETKRKLDGMGRELAFLSIDVVGSTAMKETEDSATAQIDFAEYRKMVEAIFNANGVIKAAWTPDGVMACFSNIDTAVRAGQSVINSLERFNREVKLMKADFAVRCGVNSGFIYLDDATPLEQVSDRVIDIAGHMQKYAEPNTVAVAKTVIKPMGDLGGFVATNKVVDGLEVYSWMPHATKPS
jgi:class 3 adenylate cyclase